MIVTELGLPHITEVTMVHATIPRNSNNSCNVTASHTKAAVAKKLMDKAGKELWISG